MMRTASEKLAIIRLVEDAELSVRQTLDEIKVSRTSFYRMLKPRDLITSPHFTVMQAM